MGKSIWPEPGAKESMPHPEFLELCAAAFAGELSPDELRNLAAHLAECTDCRIASAEYDLAARGAIAALAADYDGRAEQADAGWSVEEAERRFMSRFGGAALAEPGARMQKPAGNRFAGRPTQLPWREAWMPFAAVVLLTAALGVATYRTGLRRASETTRKIAAPSGRSASLEETISDTGHERAQLIQKIACRDKEIGRLKRDLLEEQKSLETLKARSGPGAAAAVQQPSSAVEPSGEFAKSMELRNSLNLLVAERNAIASRAAALEEKATQLTQRMQDRDKEIGAKQEEFARQKDLLDRDRDIRELMGARELYIAEVHDVAGTGETSKTYGRIFYTRAQRLIFYAYDLDAQPAVRNATFQAWGRRGPGQQHNLGIFYEDNAAKKRWVLKTNDARALDDIDAVFVTVEPNGGSPSPSGKQLLFAYLRAKPNHP